MVSRNPFFIFILSLNLFLGCLEWAEETLLKVLLLPNVVERSLELVLHIDCLSHHDGYYGECHREYHNLFTFCVKFNTY